MKAPGQRGVPVALDQLAELLALLRSGRHRVRLRALPAEPLLDPVLAQQGRQLLPEMATVGPVHQGRSSARASSSVARISSTWRASTPWSASSSIAASSTV